MKPDEVKNEDDDDDDASDRELNDSAENSGRHGVGIFPADPPDIELSSAVDQTVHVWDANDQQHSDGYTLCLNKPSNANASAILEVWNNASDLSKSSSSIRACSHLGLTVITQPAISRPIILNLSRFPYNCGWINFTLCK